MNSFPTPGRRELCLVSLGFTLLAIALTSPLAFRLGSVGRVDNGDGQFAIWNVAWVARTLVVDPAHVFDANIFHPHRGTLAYSEANLGAGLLAVPVYWLTRNPYAAFNVVVLLSFVFSAIATYCLVRYLSGSRGAAIVAAICFAYCPYVLSHLPHIQLLMTAGLPLSLLAFHRLSDTPSTRRGLLLGLAMALQNFFCAYYGIFGMLLIGFAVIFFAASRRMWRVVPYWKAVGVATAVAAGVTAPLFLPYLSLQQETGFNRSLDAAREFSASWRSYVASASYAHAWMLTWLGRWGEVLFPGFVASVCGAAGVVVSWQAGGRGREAGVFYAAVAALAAWLSWGPGGGLYRVLYATVPAFEFMRAPSRFGVLVSLALAVLSGFTISALAARSGRRTLTAAVLAGAAAAELAVPLRLPTVPPEDPVYGVLATLPRGAVIEMPIFSHRFRFMRTRYMLSSTVHWMPIVNAYSDHTPAEFLRNADTLAQFPTREAFALLDRDGVRYAVFHRDLYNEESRHALEQRLAEFAPYLRRLYAGDRTWLFEIVGSPP